MRSDIQPQELWPGLNLDQQVAHAFEWARGRLMSAKRFDGEPVFFHALRVASILSEEFSVRGDEAIIVALLHDIIEDGNTTRAELRAALRARAAFSNAWKMIGLLRLAPQSDEVSHATKLVSLRLAEIDPVHRHLES